MTVYKMKVYKPHPKSYLFNRIIPFITPVYDGFKMGELEPKGNVTFVTVRTYEEHSPSDVIAYTEKIIGGHWLIPTVQVAGMKWQLNPQTDEITKEYVWLLVEAK